LSKDIEIEFGPLLGFSPSERQNYMGNNQSCYYKDRSTIRFPSSSKSGSYLPS